MTTFVNELCEAILLARWDKLYRMYNLKHHQQRLCELTRFEKDYGYGQNITRY